jgi:predicted kinase
MELNQLVGELDRLLPDIPAESPKGSLLIMVGLPGSGKSFIVESVARLLPSVVISTDRVRLFICPEPTYAAAEMALVYEICHCLVERRLARGQRVIFDGSNYLAARRDFLVNLARQWGVTAAVCHVQATPETVRHRLAERHSGHRRADDVSDADWDVYQWMAAVQEPITSDHLLLDTTSTPPEQSAARLRDYWLAWEGAEEQGSGGVEGTIGLAG